MLGPVLADVRGRLFDAVAALTGRWGEVHYEAQAAIEFMAATDGAAVAAAAPLCPPEPLAAGEPAVIPVGPIVCGALAAVQAGAGVAELSARFHRTLIDLWTDAAATVARRHGLGTVVLAGGVFQNELLLTGVRDGLRARGLDVRRPLQLPANDGAVALGQAVVARTRC